MDVGTGTGAIALAIADERPDARVVRDRPLAARRCGSPARTPGGSALEVTVAAGDLLDAVDVGPAGRVDLVVSNPPYVEAHELDALPAEVLADPEVALFGVGRPSTGGSSTPP